MNLFDFTGRVAVVTGSSSGLGADAARAYAAHGAKVALLARRKDKLEAIADEIKKNGGTAFPVQCDVSDENSVKAAIEAVIKEFGKIDILLNNAGIAALGAVDTIEKDTWDKVFAINSTGPLLVSKYVVPHMKAQKYGRIVNTSSVNAILGDKHPALVRIAYNASKSAVLGLTKGMATSLMMFGISVNAVGPGLFESEMTAETLFKAEDFMKMYNMLCPAGRPGGKGELNGPILFFSSEAASYTTGQVIYVDGGFSST